MLRDWFNAEIARMGVLKFPPENIDEHFKALADIPPAVLERGISHAIRTRAWFPTVAELRADCDASGMAARAVQEPEPAKIVHLGDVVTHTIRNPFGGAPIAVRVDREYHHDCETCSDTGNAPRWCGTEPSARWPWYPLLKCLRRHEHSPHDWTESCVCVDINPTIRRRKARQEQHYSQEPAKVG